MRPVRAGSAQLRSLPALRGRVFGMREAEHHHDIVRSGVGDGVPDTGGNVQRVARPKRHCLVVQPQLARTGDDVGDLLGFVLDRSEYRSRGEDRIPERGGIAIYPAGRDEHPTPAPLGELDRLDRIEVYYGYSAHSPSLRM